MQKLSRWLAAALTLGLFLGLAQPGGALSLADLDGGASSFDSLGGSLTFDGFEVGVGPSLSQDLEDYLVIALDDGFRIVGPIGVADGNAGDLVVSYDVWANDGFVITGASVFFNGAAFGDGAFASVSEDLFFVEGQEPGEDLGVLVTGAGFKQKFDSVMFAPSSHIQSVLKDIQVSAVEGDGATISVIDQRYSVVPEPGTLALLAGGLVILARGSRKR